MGLFFCRELVLPLLPACPNLLDLFVIDHHMHCYDVTGDRTCIGQTRQSSTIQPCKRHNEPVLHLLWMYGKSTSAGSLLQRNIGHHDTWSEEQRRLQAKNLWTVEH